MTLKKVLILSLIGLIIAMVVIGGVFFFVLNKDNNSEEVEKEYFVYEINELYTNIKDSTRILKIDISVEYTDKELLMILEKNKAKVTNDILELLRNKTIEELSGKSGQQQTRNDILVKIEEAINSQEISNIYFTEFITQ